ncbi:hypothetical protein SprV_1002867100 [Sparganum proliferum]
MAKVTPASCRFALERPLQKKVKPAPTSSSWPCSESRVSQSAAMSPLYRACSRAISAVFRSGRVNPGLSKRERTLPAARSGEMGGGNEEEEEEEEGEEEEEEGEEEELKGEGKD